MVTFTEYFPDIRIDVYMMEKMSTHEQQKWAHMYEGMAETRRNIRIDRLTVKLKNCSAKVLPFP